ncbi:MAG TPA: ABC transporter ATP-binding protein [Rhodanobacteraceae bacterium]|nr:ABC transporter ATP-binding protein [Rhodanobacteraceae bacterium]
MDNLASATHPVASNAPAVAVRGLVKRFDKHEVLRGLDWQVPSGRVIGLLGRNGAGKTTLLRCLVGLSSIDAGSVDLFGASMAEPGGERLHRLGFVPQTFDLFPWMKVRGYLDFTAAFYPRWDHTLAERLLDSWQIDRKQKIGQLSQGQRQKLAIVRSLAPDPDLLLLDEPVASLDPQARRAFMDELMALVQRPGKTVVFSTHITADLERAGADIALLKDGRIVLESALPELRQRIRRVRFTRASGWPDAPPQPGVLRTQVKGDTLEWIVDGVDDASLNAVAAREGATLTIDPMSLEDLFVELA